MDMKLFLVVWADDNGENHDFFVTAATPQEAIETWKTEPFNEDYADEAAPRVFAVPPVSNAPLVHEWDELH